MWRICLSHNQVTLDGTMCFTPRPGPPEQMEIVAPNAKVRSLRVASVESCWIVEVLCEEGGSVVNKWCWDALGNSKGQLQTFLYCTRKDDRLSAIPTKEKQGNCDLHIEYMDPCLLLDRNFMKFLRTVPVTCPLQLFHTSKRRQPQSLAYLSNNR